ncbi:MAG: two-component system OmpR family response regulator [Vicingaceae bacterium]|jgi:DNA-binding response OmpR family regulator
MENKNTTILVVEDDENLGKMLTDYLKVKGFEVILKRDGEAGLKGFIESEVDLCLLDVMMPKKDGFTLAKEIRGLKSSVPIIFLSAKTMEEDLKMGFQSGADDYITKPFSMEVLMLRIEAIMRRINQIEDNLLHKKEFDINEYKFYPEKQLIIRGDFAKKLTSKENELLRLLCMYMGNVVDRNDALNMVWGDDNYFNSRSMDVYITKLRKIFKEDENIQIINSHGKGFKLLVD